RGKKNMIILICDRKNIIDTDAVYANFTSGSTGTPKAVVVSHRSVIDFITCFTEIFGIEASDNIANQAPFDFDVSVKDIFSGVFTGAAVHLVPKMFFSFPTKLLDYLEEREITILIWAVSALCIVSTLNGFDYKVPGKLRKIMFSGEVMPVKQLEIWKKFIPDAEYINLYGPTEITCNCTYFRIPKDADLEAYTKGIPMGQAFPNERILLLDEDDRLITETDKEGEVCVSGTCVALGYYNNEKQTKYLFKTL
ncbi:AMP-binding protein, partial [Treponema sp. JC4]|uniref:AMP-binding protein n=1 Tax=Treponema sp. JC4 TaxID=1124982 RepID=UPI001ED940A6